MYYYLIEEFMYLIFDASSDEIGLSSYFYLMIIFKGAILSLLNDPK